MEDWEFPDPSAPIEKAPSRAMSRRERILDIEEEIHYEAASLVGDAMHFADVEQKVDEEGNALPPELPEAWVKELGEERAKRRMRVAQLALLPAKDAPVGLKMATATLVGMAKVSAAKNAPARTLNMVVVNMQAPLPELPELEVLK